MKTATHGNGTGLNDLHILPETDEEARSIIEWLTREDLQYTWERANVKGHDWYGKHFIDVPFAEGLELKIYSEVTSEVNK